MERDSSAAATTTQFDEHMMNNNALYRCVITYIPVGISIDKMFGTQVNNVTPLIFEEVKCLKMAFAGELQASVCSSVGFQRLYSLLQTLGVNSDLLLF